MKDYEALDYAYELRDHLYTANTLDEIEPKLKSDLDNLSAIEDKIHHLNRELDSLKQLAMNLDKEYQIYNFRYGLGESHSDFENTKLMRKEIWAKIYQSGEDREKYLSELRTQRKLRDQISKEVVHLQKRFESTRNFFNQNKNLVSLYSIVTATLSGDELTFVLITEAQRERASMGNLDVYSIDSPLGGACLGKRSEEIFGYVAPSGRTISGVIIKCEFPTAEQMDDLISTVEPRPLSQRPTQINPFELFDRYGSNNSRNRKGG